MPEDKMALKAQLAEDDAASIRAIREFILAKFPGDPLLPPELVEHENAVKSLRTKLK